MFQRWEHLLFVHWRWDALQVQRTLPRGLTVDTFHGGAWLGLSPLFLANVRPRFMPAMPLLSNFLEMNLRTYVFDEAGRPGVYFYSLDCDQPLVVEMANRFLHLRYEHATMRGEVATDGVVAFESRRQHQPAGDAFRYRPVGASRMPDVDSLEFFLLERYRLFTDEIDSRAHSVRIHHLPYWIRDVELALLDPITPRLAGFDPHGRAPDHVCAAGPVDVDVYLPEIPPLASARPVP